MKNLPILNKQKQKKKFTKGNRANLKKYKQKYLKETLLKYKQCDPTLESENNYKEDFYSEFTYLIHGEEYNIEKYFDILDNIDGNNIREREYGDIIYEYILQIYEEMDCGEQEIYFWDVLACLKKYCELWADDFYPDTILERMKDPISQEIYIELVKADSGYSYVMQFLPQDILNNHEFILKLAREEYEYKSLIAYLSHYIPKNLFKDINFMRQFYKISPVVVDYQYLHIDILFEFPGLDWSIKELLKKFNAVQIQRALPHLEVLSEFKNIRNLSEEIIVPCVLIQTKNIRYLSDILLEYLQLSDLKTQTKLCQQQKEILELLFIKGITLKTYFPNMLLMVYEPFYLYDLSGDLFEVHNWFLQDDFYQIIDIQYPELGKIIVIYNDIIITQENYNQIRETIINKNEEVVGEIFYCD